MSKKLLITLVALSALLAGGYFSYSFNKPGLIPVNLLQLNGKPFDDAVLQGRPVLVNFWASWCEPCREEMPELNELSKRTTALSVLGIAIDDKEHVQAFLAKQPVDYAIALAAIDGYDWMGTLGNTNKVLPFTVLFDKDGRIAYRHVGPIKLAEIEKILLTLLN